MHLARKFILHFQSRQQSLRIDEDEVFCVAAAGLLHDIGHGPFSHVFDGQFMPAVTNQSSGQKKFRHEDMSVMLIDDLFQANGIEIAEKQQELIKALISPSTYETVYQEYRMKRRGFLFEIVANEINGIDVDKMDYLLRDSRNTGTTVSFTFDRLLQHARVECDCRFVGTLCFSEYLNVVDSPLVLSVLILIFAFCNFAGDTRSCLLRGEDKLSAL